MSRQSCLPYLRPLKALPDRRTTKGRLAYSSAGRRRRRRRRLRAPTARPLPLSVDACRRSSQPGRPCIDQPCILIRPTLTKHGRTGLWPAWVMRLASWLPKTFPCDASGLEDGLKVGAAGLTTPIAPLVASTPLDPSAALDDGCCSPSRIATAIGRVVAPRMSSKAANLRSLQEAARSPRDARPPPSQAPDRPPHRLLHEPLSWYGTLGADEAGP
jgi:hypothetical protein